MIDHEGDTIVIPTYWDSADVTTLAEAQAIAAGLETLLEDVSGADVLESEVSFPIAASDAANPSDGYSVHTGATLSFLNSDGVADSIYIPAVLESLVTNKVVQDTGDMGTLITAFTTATGVGANNERISSRGSGALWSSFRGGKRSNRKT